MQSRNLTFLLCLACLGRRWLRSSLLHKQGSVLGPYAVDFMARQEMPLSQLRRGVSLRS